jgi:hypothetical protein
MIKAASLPSLAHRFGAACLFDSLRPPDVGEDSVEFSQARKQVGDWPVAVAVGEIPRARRDLAALGARPTLAAGTLSALGWVLAALGAIASPGTLGDAASARPVISAPGDQPHPIAVALDVQPIAIIFDFVKPIRRVWDVVSPRRNAEPVRVRQENKIGTAAAIANLLVN